MRKRILKSIIAMALVLTLTMANFIFLGASFVSYAVGTLNQSSDTNNANVKFNAYFKTENGEKTEIKSEKISEGNMKLYMEVSVQNEGYFNGKVDILSSNFEIKSQELSEGINKIDGNQIKVLVDSDTHDNKLANNIMRTIQESYENKVYITVQFK